MALRYAFSIDLDRCIGCRACVVACRIGNETTSEAAYLTVSEIVRREETGLWGSFAHHRCFHCGSAPCVLVCPTGALSKWQGLTAVSPERCSGCGYCTDACPFQVPRVCDGQVAKCIACLDQVKGGEPPWCERTCPDRAIRFGEREAVLAEARTRADGLRARHPRAQVYGETQLGGLGLLLVLLDRPAAYGLPEKPEPPASLRAWQEVVQPATIGLTALTAAATGLAFVVARRRHLPEPPVVAPEAGADGPAACETTRGKDGEPDE